MCDLIWGRTWFCRALMRRGSTPPAWGRVRGCHATCPQRCNALKAQGPVSTDIHNKKGCGEYVVSRNTSSKVHSTKGSRAFFRETNSRRRVAGSTWCRANKPGSEGICDQAALTSCKTPRVYWEYVIKLRFRGVRGVAQHVPKGRGLVAEDGLFRV